MGSIPFGNGNVLFSMSNDFMQSSKADIEFLLEHYRMLLYNGNFDIICNHSGILDMINELQWTGSSAYQSVVY